MGAVWQSRPHAVEWGPDGQLVDLGAMYLDGTVSAALAINDRGQVVGSVANQLEEGRAALWFDGVLTVLPGLRSGDSYYALDINRGGLILGFTYPRGLGEPENARAIIWKANRVRSLGTLGQRCWDACDTTPAALNNVGQVVGVSTLVSGAQRAFVWQNGHMTDLGTVPGGKESGAAAINEHGLIVGTATTKNGQTHAVLWTLRSG